MKKLLSIVFVCCVMLSIGSVNAVEAAKLNPKPVPTPTPTPEPFITNEKQSLDYYKMKDISINNGLLYDNPDTLTRIEGYSDIIIEGRPTGDSEQVVVVDLARNYIDRAYTLTTIIIDKVYRGDVRIGDTVTVAEPYYIMNDNTAATNQYYTMDDTVYHKSVYYPSEIDKSYLWFLTDMSPEYEHYALVMWERGRYPVLNMNTKSATALDELSKEELNLSPSGEEKNETVYRDILKDAAAKYMK